jgi:acetaldehyde dehydrogenase (acetylating)
MSIHSRNEQVILEFGLKKPAFRIVVNSPTTHGSIGLTTGLDPAMTLGCGGYGGNITSDNISPRHLLNIKRLAYEISPARRSGQSTAARASESSIARPAPPGRAAGSSGIGAEALTSRIDAFLASRGFRSAGDEAGKPRDISSEGKQARPPPEAPQAAATPPLDFVCEEDVRQAVRAGRKLVISERAIVTPAARDLGEQHQVFAVAPSLT